MQRKLNQGQHQELCRRNREDGETAYRLSKEFNLSLTATYRLLNGETYKDWYQPVVQPK